MYNGNCVGGCPAKTYNSACVDYCPDATFEYNNNCMDACPSHTIVDANRCTDNCLTGLYKYNQRCVSECPTPVAYIFYNECREECWKSGFFYKSPGSNECVYSCPNMYEWKTSTCIDQCEPGQKIAGNGCYDECPSSAAFTDGNQCTTECPIYLDVSTRNCVDSCPVGTDLNGNRCEKQTPICNTNQYLAPDNTCQDIPSCSSTQTMGSDGKCYDSPSSGCNSTQYVNSNGTCVDYVVCSGNQYLDADGKCHDYVNSCPFWYNKTCMAECPKGTLITAWNSCVDSCPEYMYRNGTACVFTCDGGAAYNGTCVSRCPHDAPVAFMGKCIESCPTGSWLIDGKCEFVCNGYYLGDKCVDRCPSSMVILYDKHCIERCPSDTIQIGTRCESRCPSGQMYMNGVCYDYGIWANMTEGHGNSTWVNPCPTGDNTCVDYGNSTWVNPCPDGQYMTSTGTCMKPCDSNQWYWNNTCIPACRDGEVFTMEGKCMNMVSLCHDVLPGSVMNDVSRSCECPDGQWITRDLEAKDPSKIPVKCAPGGPARIDCRSFVANSVYDEDLNNCVCNAENPVVVPVADATWFPYACAPAGTATTVKQCLTPEFFDFMEGRCMLMDSTTSTVTPKPRPSVLPSATMTAKPSVSSRPSETRTALPSRYPSRSGSATRTAKPSDIPGSPSPSISASRSVKPSARVYADVTRVPLPSMIAVRPPPAEVRKSPAPSPWPKKVVVEIPPEEKPAYIDARMTMAGANATEMAKPERIQQVQASLACTLRMPLENIRIQNITATDAAGRKTRVPVDPAAFMMVGDGSSDCYDFRSGSRRMLRALSASSGAIEIDYAIVAPSDDILAMDTTQFNEVISKSPVLFAAVVAAGGSGVTAQAVDAQKAVFAPLVSPSPSPSATSMMDIRMIVGIGVGGVALVTAAVVISIFSFSEKKRAKREAEEKAKAAATPRVVLMYASEEKHHVMNPLTGARVYDYGAETTRRALGPMKATHGPVFGTAV
jgi:hypothetical protein